MQKYRTFELEAHPAGNGVSWLRDKYNGPLWLLFGITGLVLLIACANLANLMLARGSAREREFAVRLAIGASRGVLIRQCLSESLLLSVTGSIAGLAIAQVLSRRTVEFLGTEEDPLHFDFSTDWRMIAFTAAVAVGACVLFGLVPAWQASRMEPGAAMKAGGRGQTPSRERFQFQRMLVVLQVSISLVLVAAAFLFVLSFQNLMRVDPGFRPDGILVTNFDTHRLRLPPTAIPPFERELLDRVRSTPGVDAAAITTMIMLGGGSWTMGVRAGELTGGSKFTWVSPKFFDTLKIPILSGRDFNASDTPTSPHVAIVNQKFVHDFMSGRLRWVRDIEVNDCEFLFFDLVILAYTIRQESWSSHDFQITSLFA